MPQSVISEHFTITPITPCKTGHSGAKEGEIKLWLKCFSSATAVFKERGKNLDFIGVLGWKRRIYTFGRSDRYLRHMETTRDMFCRLGIDEWEHNFKKQRDCWFFTKTILIVTLKAV